MQVSPHIYIFIGPEGAGKSTQAKLLAQAIGLPSISTGDMLRFFASHDTGFLGDAARKMFAKNGYLDALLMNQILSKSLSDEKFVKGVVLDGSLRTLEETLHFDEALAKANRLYPVTVFLIDISEEESYTRLTYGRKREDDTVEGVARRLAHFNTQKDERVTYIREHYQLLTINGMQNKEAVHAEIMEKIQQSTQT